MVSRENVVIGLCVLSALPAAYVVEALTGSYELSMGALFGVGILLPTVLTEYVLPSVVDAE